MEEDEREIGKGVKICLYGEDELNGERVCDIVDDGFHYFVFNRVSLRRICMKQIF